MLHLFWILLLCVVNTGTLVSADTKIANRTIERVSMHSCLGIPNIIDSG
jgi:hypothetical protein